MLTLLGPQGTGKTSFFRMLVPADKSSTWFGEGKALDVANKDSQLELTSWWIMEIGEVDGVTKKEQPQLKALLTAAEDSIREPYERKPTPKVRHCSVCASVNNPEFLRDETGNRRWWTLQVDKIDLGKMPDAQQLWAQLEDIWQAADQKSQTCFRLSEAERESLAERNRNAEADVGYEDELLKQYPAILADTRNRSDKTLAEICDDVFGDRPYNRSDKIAMSRTLTKLGIRRKIIGGRRLFEIPLFEIPSQECDTQNSGIDPGCPF